MKEFSLTAMIDGDETKIGTLVVDDKNNPVEFTPLNDLVAEREKTDILLHGKTVGTADIYNGKIFEATVFDVATKSVLRE